MKDLIDRIDDVVWRKQKIADARRLQKSRNQMESSVRQYFRKQRTWLYKGDNWMKITPGKRIYWKHWNKHLARELQQPLMTFMKSGGIMAQQELGITTPIPWDNEVVQRTVNDYSIRLAKELNRTTNMKIRKSIKQGIKKGESKAQLKRRVKEIMKTSDSWRPHLIARTETMRIYNSTMEEVYKAAGIEKKKWLTFLGCCSFCKQLSGRIVKIDSPFMLDVYGPPAHPNCRCFVKAVKEVGWKHGGGI